MRTIALEEHFLTGDLAHYSDATRELAQPQVWQDASKRLTDLAEQRLADMDAAGVDVAVLSLTAPGIQAEPDPQVAVARAAEANDFLAGLIAANPTRYRGFAALPLQNPDAAANELQRAVEQLGLCGALVNAHTLGSYLDAPPLRVVWERAEALDVPLYLHPANGFDTPHVIGGHPELIGPMWSWGTDTATHALRLIFGGVFDDFPGAKLLLGHMGESLPYSLWRLDSRWDWHRHHGIELELEHPSKYLRRNLYVTTSGVCDDAPLLCALSALGPEHVLFATDYPYEDIRTATAFLAGAPIGVDDRAKISHRNAERLLHIDP
ncbi:amidohydrolase family protein [Mycolicibacterium diernhoferi]|uniref:Amidohydrolase n=1 Tax=Mycolicibacterium diernhoferi TaxID=1801 RepID=A0A1Q4H8M3_9MYCO|nr:amidohydrolase family protein [Mycolicibacterium diernhoferi]OJZ63772.1 amidohydrolase [Mycolicibacterium diernhoferi]OPE48872.1 amidohydrolase [Mycolicibacterium diernhoferi]PEG54263.1 amidohydrolase [Mycolicibacterium diernhoferi]QYL21516.1 amidohydrolase family protein [Mycolicibacterium diernhoferi]